ncbi:MAG: hypothetical protein ACK2UK_12975 [Candidatus Promineifilaceae bacterium]
MSITGVTLRSTHFWLVLAVLIIVGVIAVALTLAASGIQIAGLSAFDPAVVPHEFLPWGIDANKILI